jgi:uncharacterized protein YlaN (UPF0358 family)
MSAPNGAKASSDIESPTMNQYLQQCANKAMTSSKNEVKQHQINMPSQDKGAGYEEVKYQMEGLTLDNDAKYEKLDYRLEGSTEEVIIPEEVPQVSAEQENIKQLYYVQMNNLYSE